MTRYFYPGSFDLKLLQSTRQGDFASLQRGLNPLYVIEKGGCANWGQLPDFAHKTDKFCLGFTAEAQRAVRRAQIGRPPMRITNPKVNAIKDDDEESEFDSWIYPTTDGGLSNWTAKDFVPISFIPQ